MDVIHNTRTSDQKSLQSVLEYRLDRRQAIGLFKIYVYKHVKFFYLQVKAGYYSIKFFLNS